MIKYRLREVGVAATTVLSLATYSNVIATTTPATASNVITGSTTGTSIVNSSYFFSGNLCRMSADKVLFVAHDGVDDGESINDGKLSQQTFTISTSSWGSITTAYDPGAGKNCLGPQTFSRGNGTLWSFFTEFTTANSATTSVLKRMISMDYGVTWAAPTTIKTFVTGFSQATNLLTFANDANRMLLIVSGYASPDIQLLESTNGGTSFPTTITLYGGGLTLSECSVVNINDTNLIAVLRDDAGNRLLMSKSVDGGATWSAPASTGLGAATGVKVQPRIYKAAGRNDRLIVLFYDRGDSRFKWLSTTTVTNALANTWDATYLLGTGARGYGDICVIDEINKTYLVTNDKEILAIECDRLWWTVKDIYASSIYPAPFISA